jgi:hypothetical protein
MTSTMGGDDVLVFDADHGRDPAAMSTSVMRTVRNGCRKDEATIRFMIEALRGAEPSGGSCALIDSA